MLICLALGGNLGQPLETLNRARKKLEASFDTSLHMSSYYKTRAMTLDGSAGPDYINAAATFESTLVPQEILRVCLDIETDLGRTRTEGKQWTDRTIDIDLLLAGDTVINTLDLTIPHPRLHERDFVLFPLCEIAPNMMHPILKTTISELTARLEYEKKERFVLEKLR